MTDLIITIKPYLEALYLFSGAFIFIGVFLTFIQLLTIKNDNISRDVRLSKEHALKSCERYLNRYVELSSKEFKMKAKNGINKYTGPIGNFTKQSIPDNFLPDIIKHMMIEESLSALNELEIISSYFVTGVSDEETGFAIISRSFCHTVETKYGIISACRDDVANDYWTNTIELYRIWRPRLSKAELEKSAESLEEQAKRIWEKAATT